MAKGRGGLSVVVVAVVLGLGFVTPASAERPTMTRAVVDVDVSPPTVRMEDLLDAFGPAIGEVWQVVNGEPVPLNVVSWSPSTIVAELASAAPGDSLVAVLPAGALPLQRALYAFTVPGANPAAPCFDNATRFVNCENGTVTDTVSGLVWLFRSGCLGSGNYRQANKAAAALASGQCGLTDGSEAGDWRLPTAGDWTTIFNPSCPLFTPLLVGNQKAGGCFEDSPWALGVADVFYWTSSSLAGSPGFFNTESAYDADVFMGALGIDLKTRGARIWPVRSSH